MLFAALVSNVRDPVAVVLRNLSQGHSRVGVHGEVAELVDTTHGGVAGLHDVSQVGVLRNVKLLSSIHSRKLRHHLLKESLSRLVFSSIGRRRENETFSFGGGEGVVKGLSAILFVESDYRDASLDGSHLGHDTLGSVRLVTVKHKLVSGGEASFEQAKGKGRTVSIELRERPINLL